MKIALVVPYFYPMVGGLESYAHYVSMHLSVEKNVEVFVITSNHLANGNSQDIVDGIRVHRLQSWFKLSNTPINPLWIFHINAILSQEKPDLIFAHTPVPFIADVAAFLCALKKIPCVLMYHAGNLRKNQFLPDLIVSVYTNTFEKLLFLSTKKLIVLNEFVKKTTLKEYVDKVELVLPGVPVQNSTISYKQNNSNRVLFIGKLDRSHSWKGLQYLLQAFAAVTNVVPTATLTVVGGGDNLLFYQQLSKQLNISSQVFFVGSKPSSVVGEYYKKSDILVLPSTSSAESLGFVLLEAMKFALPLVGSNIGGIPYVLKNKVNGLLVGPKDVQGLTKAIITLLTEKNFYKKVSQNNVEEMKKYSWESHTKKLVDIFKNVIKKDE